MEPTTGCNLLFSIRFIDTEGLSLYYLTLNRTLLPL